MNDKIMAGGNLDNIADRLTCGVSLVCMLCEVVGTSSITEEALRGVGDLFESIVRDFRADIAAAEDYRETPWKEARHEES
ncbi:MAG: hypothetical protein K2O18_14225 [Oscillospiraceae bacterium]|nr:hypothetical protein [Oscillospiraceae bacterium]